jgi:hypothetical protein
MTWIQQIKIYSNDAAANEEFGESVSITEDYAIVSAYHDGVNGYRSGAAYIYKTK